VSNTAGQRIEQWTVLGGNRIAGQVYNRPNHLDGTRIVTSPIAEIRMMGDGSWMDTYPVAFTESGHAYRLGQPARSFGACSAKDFVHATMDSGEARQEPRRDGELVDAALDTSFCNFETIEVYETSFKPL
jgi:hypothetical protein